MEYQPLHLIVGTYDLLMRIGKVIFGIFLLLQMTFVQTFQNIRADNEAELKTIWSVEAFTSVYKYDDFMLIRRPGKAFLHEYNHDVIWLGNGCSVWFNKNSRLKEFMDSSHLGTDKPIYTFSKNLVIATKNDFTSCFDLLSGRFLWENKFLGNVSKIVIGNDETACSIYDIIYRKLSFKLLRFSLKTGEIIDETTIMLDEPKEKNHIYSISLLKMHENFIFTLVNSQIHCYDLKSGKDLWQCLYTQSNTDRLYFFNGALIFYNSNSYENCNDHVMNGSLSAIDVNTGKFIWKSISNWFFDVQGDDVYYLKTKCEQGNVNCIIKQNVSNGEIVDSYPINEYPSGVYELNFAKDYIFATYCKQWYENRDDWHYLVLDRDMELIIDKRIGDSFFKDHWINYFGDTFLIATDTLKKPQEENMSLVALPNYRPPSKNELIRVFLRLLIGNL